MKPTSEQTRNAILSAVPFPEELLILETLSATRRRTQHMLSPQPIRLAVDPSLAYGCVDWYLYPDSKRESVAA